MATSLLYFGADIAALTAVALTGAGCLIATPRSFNARMFACVTVSPGCYLLGRLSKDGVLAPPAGVEPTTYRLGGGRSIH